jgi:hypothetical protein
VGRDTAAAAGQNSQTANTLAGTYNGQAANNSSILTPTLNQLATNPTGFGQQTINNMDTAALQSAGGAASGIVGQGNLQAARTNNAGSFAPAAAQAGHDATAQLSDAALGVQNQNAMLKQQQQQEGISGEEGMYDTNVGAGENALGLSNSALNTQNQADQQTLDSWVQPLQALTSPFKITKQLGCWIAEAVYGVEDSRTHTVRAYLNGAFRNTLRGDLTMRLYLAVGRQVAWFVLRSALLRCMFKPMFDSALRSAEAK